MRLNLEPSEMTSAALGWVVAIFAGMKAIYIYDISHYNNHQQAVHFVLKRLPPVLKVANSTIPSKILKVFSSSEKQVAP